MRRLLLAAAAALAVAAVAAPAPSEAQGRRWGDGYFPNLPVVTQDGKTLRFYDDVLKGKIVIVNFMYTNCPDICGLATARLSQAEERLRELVGKELFFVSLTVDPEHDTPQKLKEFADSFGIGDGWLFLTGKPEDIRAINAQFGERSGSLDQHRLGIVLGNDATGEWARNSALGDMERFILDVRSMDPKWRDRVMGVRTATSDSGYELSTEPGQVLFKKMCAPCHTIGVGDRVGPDLRDVTLRRDRDWLTRFIIDASQMRREKDPTALALADKYKGVRMPRLGLTKNDAEDMITYLEPPAARLTPHHVAPPPRAQDRRAVLPGGPSREIRHRARNYLGKPALVFFGFTNCPDVCPTTLYQLSNMLEQLKADADRLNVLFITVDPERDTPGSLRSISRRSTRGSPACRAPARASRRPWRPTRPMSARSRKDGDYTMDHTAAIFMIDGKGQYVGTISHRETDAAIRAKLRHLLDAAHS